MLLAVTINMDEDFHIELTKKQHRQYQEQFSTSDTESSEHEAPGNILDMLLFNFVYLSLMFAFAFQRLLFLPIASTVIVFTQMKL